MQESAYSWLVEKVGRPAGLLLQILEQGAASEVVLCADLGIDEPAALHRLIVETALTAQLRGHALPLHAFHLNDAPAWRLADAGAMGPIRVGTADPDPEALAVVPTDAQASASAQYRKLSNDRAGATVMLRDAGALASDGFAFLERPRLLLVRADQGVWVQKARALALALLSQHERLAKNALWIPQMDASDEQNVRVIDFALRLTRVLGETYLATDWLLVKATSRALEGRGWRVEVDPPLDAARSADTSFVNALEEATTTAGAERALWTAEAVEADDANDSVPPEAVEAPDEDDDEPHPLDDPHLDELAMPDLSESAIEQTLIPASKLKGAKRAKSIRAATKPPISEAPTRATPTSRAPARSRPPSERPAPGAPPPPPALRLILTANNARLIEGETEHWHRELSWPNPREHRFAGARLAVARRRLPVDWPLETVEAFGEALAAVTFGDDPPPLSVFQAVRRLVIEAGEKVPDLPWEYLRLEGHFLAGLRLSIVRHVDARAEPRPLRSSEPDPVAFAAANPNGEQRFDVARHADTIFLDGMQFTPRLHCDADSLRTLAEDPKIEGFHFLGHGHPRHLAVEGEPGKVEAGKIAGWLSTPEKLKFVFLGACHSGAMLPRDEEGTSGVASTIARETGVPVVAMQLSVSQHYSTEFAAAFYRHFKAAEWDIEEAVYRTRRATYDTALFGVPVLYADTKQAAVPVLDDEAKIEQIERVVVQQIAAKDAADWLQKHEAAPELITQVKQGGALPKPDFGNPIQAIKELARAVAETASQEDSWVAQSRRALAPRPADFDTLSVSIETERALDPDWSVIEPDGPVSLALRQYAFEPTLIQRIVGELYAGRHVLLTGPVGTGKTTLARAIATALGDPPVEATAHAEWSTQDVVGGFWPQPQKNGSTQLVFRNGCVTEAILRNWVQAGDEAVWRHTPNRTWLIIDELNRADMDRAMGPLFTALESRKLMVPTVSVDVGAPTRTAVQIPKDFRILATMNTVDQHYLFRLSDALKRRFAFVEVPVVNDFEDERVKLERWLAHAFPDYVPAADPTMRALHRFIEHARAIHSVGTAILKAAMGFVAATHGKIDDVDAASGAAIRLDQAIAGSVLPTLESLSADQRRTLTTFHNDVGALPSLERLRPGDELSLH